METATKNLLSNSEEKTDYEKAITEWFFTGEFFDNKINKDRPSCELCEHKNLRWQFTINNQLNNNTLQVGSRCIKQFDIPLKNKYGEKIYGKERDQGIAKAIRIKKEGQEFNNVLEALKPLWLKDKEVAYNKPIDDCEKYWKKNKVLDPSMLAFIISRLIEHKIEYEKLNFKIETKKSGGELKLSALAKWEYELVRPYLSEKEKEKNDKYERRLGRRSEPFFLSYYPKNHT